MHSRSYRGGSRVRRGKPLAPRLAVRTSAEPAASIRRFRTGPSAPGPRTFYVMLPSSRGLAPLPFQARVAAPQRSGQIFLAGEMTGCCGADGFAQRVPTHPRLTGRHGAAALILPRPCGIRPFHGGPERCLLGPQHGSYRPPGFGNRNEPRPRLCVDGRGRVGQLGSPMHGHDHADGGVDPPGAVLVLFGEAGAPAAGRRSPKHPLIAEYGAE